MVRIEALNEFVRDFSWLHPHGARSSFNCFHIDVSTATRLEDSRSSALVVVLHYSRLGHRVHCLVGVWHRVHRLVGVSDIVSTAWLVSLLWCQPLGWYLCCGVNRLVGISDIVSTVWLVSDIVSTAWLVSLTSCPLLDWCLWHRVHCLVGVWHRVHRLVGVSDIVSTAWLVSLLWCQPLTSCPLFGWCLTSCPPLGWCLWHRVHCLIGVSDSVSTVCLVSDIVSTAWLMSLTSYCYLQKWSSTVSMIWQIFIEFYELIIRLYLKRMWNAFSCFFLKVALRLAVSILYVEI